MIIIAVQDHPSEFPELGIVSTGELMAKLSFPLAADALGMMGEFTYCCGGSELVEVDPEHSCLPVPSALNGIRTPFGISQIRIN
ncbi:hypothetical protein [Planctopirus ephydatiae]|uniref:hypothetical protein n=1 Tax=Planctopirus ephydatiae TaxID=2528019 RepID=UPI0011AB1322|nr:hypothetical protein [Planctopirus ephydatiae]